MVQLGVIQVCRGHRSGRHCTLFYFYRHHIVLLATMNSSVFLYHHSACLVRAI